MNIYTIKDDASQTCEGVYSFVNDAVAVRTLSMAAQSGQLGLVSKFPADFHIYKIGEFDEAEIKITSNEVKLVYNFGDIQNAGK